MAGILIAAAIAKEKQHSGCRVRLTQRLCLAGRPNHELGGTASLSAYRRREGSPY